MPVLQATREELLALYPRPLQRLDVLTPENKPTGLKARYLQRDSDDPYRDWDSYIRWKEANERHERVQRGRVKIPLLLPQDVADVYRRNKSYIKNGSTGQQDRLLLEFELNHGKGRMRHILAGYKGIQRRI